MSLLDEIPKEFSTLSIKLDPYGNAAKELDKIRRSSQRALDEASENGKIIQMLYDFRDNTVIFKIAGL